MKEKRIELENLNFLEKLEYIGQGACATVYKYNANTVIKIFHANQQSMYNQEDFSKIVGISNNTCVFPQKMAFINNEFIGYFAEYVQGENFLNISDDIEFEILFEAIKCVEKDLKKLSEGKILFNDFNHGGILYDSNLKRLKIVDTDFFVYNPNITPEEAFRYNIVQFYDEMLMELGMLNGQSTIILRFLSSDTEYNEKYFEYIRSTLRSGEIISIIDLIKKVIEIVELCSGKKVKTLGEIKEIVGQYEELMGNGIVEERNSDEESNIALEQFLANIAFTEQIESKKK